MTVADLIRAQVDALPEEMQREALDFLLFLRMKAAHAGHVSGADPNMLRFFGGSAGLSRPHPGSARTGTRALVIRRAAPARHQHMYRDTARQECRMACTPALGAIRTGAMNDAGPVVNTLQVLGRFCLFRELK